MPTTEEREQHRNMEQHKRELLKALIKERVIHTLGEPGDLIKVDVRPLWGSYCRVNVLIGANAASAKIANSYFLQVDGDGKIVKSTPNMTKQY